MNKIEFLQALEAGLAGANPEERAAAIQYYTEYLDDAGPERAAEVIDELGGPDKVIADILGGPAPQPNQSWAPPQGFNMPPPPHAPDPAPQWGNPNNGQAFEGQPFNGQPQQPYYPPQVGYNQGGYNQRNNNIAKIILIVLACLFLIPLFSGFGGVLVGLTIALVCLFLVPIFLGIGFTVGGIAVIVGGATIIPAFLGSGLLTIGIGIALFGLGLLCFFAGGRLLGRVLPAIFRGVGSLLGGLFGKLRSIGGNQGGNHG